MSAFLGIAYADKVELLTDGAVFHPDGRLRQIRSKVWPARNLPLVVTGRGDIGALETMAHGITTICTGMKTVDAVLDHLAKLFDGLRATAKAPFAEFLIACVSEARGPCMFIFMTKLRGWPDKIGEPIDPRTT